MKYRQNQKFSRQKLQSIAKHQKVPTNSEKSRLNGKSLAKLLVSTGLDKSRQVLTKAAKIISRRYRNPRSCRDFWWTKSRQDFLGETLVQIFRARLPEKYRKVSPFPAKDQPGKKTPGVSNQWYLIPKGMEPRSFGIIGYCSTVRATAATFVHRTLSPTY